MGKEQSATPILTLHIILSCRHICMSGAPAPNIPNPDGYQLEVLLSSSDIFSLKRLQLPSMYRKREGTP